MSASSNDIDRSYKMMALLDVCACVADHLADNPEGNARLSSNLAYVLRHVLELTEEAHDDLEHLSCEGAVQP